MLALVVLLLVQQFVEVGSGNLFGRTVSNALHVPWFGVVTLLLWHVLRRPGAARLLLACLGVALLTEIGQLFTARSASLADVGRDLLGAAPVLLGVFLVQRAQAPQRVRRRIALAAAIGVLVTAAALFPAARVLVWYEQRDALFPQLLDVDDALRTPLVTSNGDLRVVSAPADWPEFAGEPVVLIRWANVRYPGVALHEPVRDWRGYDHLVVPVYSPGTTPQSLTAAVRHEGRRGTSAYLSLPVAPGAQVLRYPLAVLRDTEEGEARIIHLMLYTSPAHWGQELFIGAVRLE